MFLRRVVSRIVRTLALTALAAAASGLPVSPAAAQTLLDEVHTLAAPTMGVPIEHTFSVANAGTYQVTLTDLGAALSPAAPLASVTLAVTGGDALVGTPLVGAGTLTLSALTAGSYVLHVVGMPGNVPGSGPIGMVVTDSSQTQIAAFQDVIALPGQALPNGEAVLDGSFTVAASGTYTIALNDLQLPSSLATLTAIVVAAGSATPVVTLPVSGAYSSTATLNSGVNYRILAVGAASTTANAGLYSATVSGTGGLAFARTVPVGATTRLGSPVLAAGNYTLSVADLAYPAALAQLGAALVLNGSPVASLSAAGSSPSFAAAAGTYDAFAVGTANSAAPGAGSYALQVLPQGGGTPALSVGRGVVASGGSLTPYAFDVTLPAAGAETVSLADFQFPAGLSSVRLAAVQGGALLGTPITGVGNLSITAASGALSLVVFAQAASGGGLFGLEVIPGGGGTPVLDATQAVGILFNSQQVQVTTAGNYSVTATDLGFPANFANYDTIVTQGTQQFGSIFGGGTFDFMATPGTYSINFLAQPSAAAQAGTYALTVAVAPPAPTVSLSVDHPQITSGGTVDLTWSTQNATSCTASGGWSGSEPLSGTVTTGALTANTTFTLSCTGPGGMTQQSVQVTVTAAPSGGGGGGAMDTLLLAVLGLLLCARALPRASRVDGPRRARRAGAFFAAGVAAALVLSGCGGAQSRFDAHMKRGQAYFAADDYSKASVEFRNAMQIEPRNAAARIMAARTFEKQTKLREAIGLYQSAVDLAPDDTEACANLARLLTFAGAAEQATKILEPALKRHPDDPLLLTLRGAARQQLGQQAEAIADVDRALKLDPDNLEAIEARAGMYRHVGDLAAATALVSAAQAKRPSSVELHEALADLYLAEGEQAKVETELRRLVELQPREPRRRYQLASFYAHAQRLDEAQKVLEDAVKALPTKNDVKLALVEFISTQRTRAQGEQLLRDFIAHDPANGELRLGLGQLLQRSGALPEAIGVYQDVVQRDPTGPQGLVAQERLARIAWAQGRVADAEKLVAQVLETSPHDNEALLLRAEMALARGDATAAITDLRAVLRDQPQAVGVYRLLASALAQTGDAALAEESLRTAVSLAPADMGLRVDLAKALLQAQHADQAVTVLEEAAQRAPADVAVREELASAYLVRHDYAAARTAAADLEQLRPQSAAGPYVEGLAAEGLKQPDEAQKSFKRALALEPQSFEALAALSRLMVSRGEIAQAVAQVKSVADHGQSPPDAHVLNLLGELYLAQHNVPLAVDALSRASAAAPAWWIPDRNLALAKLAAHDEPGAIAAYQAGIKAAPGEALPVTELAAFYESHERAADAIAIYQEAYRRNPHSQAIANNLALLLVRYRTDQASLDQARDLSAPFSTSTDGRLLDTNGWVHFKRAEYAQALPVLQRAVERQPDSREIRYHLGMAEWRSGDAAGARKDLEAALAGSGQFTGANDARVALASLGSSTG